MEILAFFGPSKPTAEDVGNQASGTANNVTNGKLMKCRCVRCHERPRKTGQLISTVDDNEPSKNSKKLKS